LISTEPQLDGYAIWFIPTGELYKGLHRLIIDLSIKFKTPSFEPHITLIGEITENEATSILYTAEIASTISHFDLELDSIDYSDNYFKCFFLKAHKTKELVQANRYARRIFNRETETQYIPHLSLIYGYLPEQEKVTLQNEMQKEISIHFEVNSLHLISIQGGIKNWHKVKEFPLYSSK
jgi:2'-5' RNA ligase